MSYVRLEEIVEARGGALRVRCEGYLIWLPKKTVFNGFAPRHLVDRAKKHETAAIIDTRKE